jgi:hypothetical protein
MELKPKSKKEIISNLKLQLEDFKDYWEDVPEREIVKAWTICDVTETMLFQLMLKQSYNQILKKAIKYGFLDSTYGFARNEKHYSGRFSNYIMGIK